MDSKLKRLVEIAAAAGEEILAVYRLAADSDAALAVERKADDSPLTEADRRAHALILRELREFTPEMPVLSEESEAVPAAVRRQWRRYWLVDPLDGTKEFIKRNGEFTVNIAEIADGVPVCGVVHVPVSGLTYAGAVDAASAWLCSPDAPPRPIRTRPLRPGGPLKVVASRSHQAPELQSVIKCLERAFKPVELISMGSSLKICLLAEGRADFYPRLLPTSEWDTAAAHAVLRAAGGQLTDTAFTPLIYNQKQHLLNPHFLALADPSQNWPDLLASSLNL